MTAKVWHLWNSSTMKLWNISVYICSHKDKGDLILTVNTFTRCYSVGVFMFTSAVSPNFCRPNITWSLSHLMNITSLFILIIWLVTETSRISYRLKAWLSNFLANRSFTTKILFELYKIRVSVDNRPVVIILCKVYIYRLEEFFSVTATVLWCKICIRFHSTLFCPCHT